MPFDAIATPAAPLTPVALLAAWEATATPAQVAAQLPHQPAVLAWLTDLAALPRLDINLDLDDARTMLQETGAIRAAQAVTQGPTRATDALRQLRAALPREFARHCLLSVLSSPTHGLEMDELSELTEIIHAELLGHEGAMIFGHGEWPELPAGAVQVWVLLGYADCLPSPLQEQLTRIQAEKAAALAQEEYEVVARLRVEEVRLLGQLGKSLNLYTKSFLCANYE